MCLSASLLEKDTRFSWLDQPGSTCNLAFWVLGNQLGISNVMTRYLQQALTHAPDIVHERFINRGTLTVKCIYLYMPTLGEGQNFTVGSTL